MCFFSSSSTIIHVFFFVRSLDTNLFCLSRSHSCSGTEVNTTEFTRSPHKIITRENPNTSNNRAIVSSVSSVVLFHYGRHFGGCCCFCLLRSLALMYLVVTIRALVEERGAAGMKQKKTRAVASLRISCLGGLGRLCCGCPMGPIVEQL